MPTRDGELYCRSRPSVAVCITFSRSCASSKKKITSVNRIFKKCVHTGRIGFCSSVAAGTFFCFMRCRGCFLVLVTLVLSLSGFLKQRFLFNSFTHRFVGCVLQQVLSCLSCRRGFLICILLLQTLFYFLAAGDFVAVTLHKFIIHMHEHVRILMCNY